MTPGAGAGEMCPDCGARIEGGAEGCQRLFEAQLARDFSDVNYFRMHRLLVDVYALQHPDRYCESFKSLAAHAMGVCATLEFAAGHSRPNEAVRRWVESHANLAKPPVPSAHGACTILDALRARDAEEHEMAVLEWAHATWAAWAPLQPTVRGWVEEALARER